MVAELLPLSSEETQKKKFEVVGLFCSFGLFVVWGFFVDVSLFCFFFFVQNYHLVLCNRILDSCNFSLLGSPTRLILKFYS